MEVARAIAGDGDAFIEVAVGQAPFGQGTIAIDGAIGAEAAGLACAGRL